ncbi:MAG: hypothetical protein QGH38_03700 [Candidatus Thalassarchaeaceae archaeon]|nr:hypothetical protein [Candidatus Thalassarchaeaceae archaeon]
MSYRLPSVKLDIYVMFARDWTEPIVVEILNGVFSSYSTGFEGHPN